MEANPENIAGSTKKMNKEYYYPTQACFTDLAIAANMNAEIIPASYKCRQQDPIGLVRTNTPQIGAWHSRTAMHTRKEFNSLTAEIFEFMHGV